MPQKIPARLELSNLGGDDEFSPLTGTSQALSPTWDVLDDDFKDPYSPRDQPRKQQRGPQRTFGEDDEDDEIETTDGPVYTELPEPGSYFAKFWAVSRFFRREICETDLFQNFILLAIVSNCVFLAFDTPSLEEDDPNLYKVVTYSEVVYFVIFLVEMIFKFIAYGFCGDYCERMDDPEDVDSTEIEMSDYDFSERTQMIQDKKTELAEFIHTNKDKKTDSYVGYFMDNWNVLDFFIVMSSFFMFFDFANVTSIRVLRVLRPLRTFSRVQGLKVLIETLLLSLPKLMDVCVLLTFMFLVFGIAGVQVLKGALRRRCVDNTYYDLHKDNFDWNTYADDGDLHGSGDSTGQFCRKEGDTEQCSQYDGRYPETDDVWGEELHPDDQQPYAYTCREVAENPENGMINFDDIFYAFFNEFQMVTLEGWMDMTFNYQAAVHPWVWPYFLCVTFITSYFALNLTLAVLTNTFGEVDELATKEAEKVLALEKAQLQLDLFKAEEEKLAIKEQTFAKADEAERLLNLGGTDDAFLKASQLAKQRSLKTKLGIGNGFSVESVEQGRGENTKVKEDEILAKRALRTMKEDDQITMREGNPIVLWCNRTSLSDYFSYFVLLVIMLNAVVLGIKWPDIDEGLESTLNQINLGFTLFFCVEMCIKLIGLGFWGYMSDGWNIFDGSIVLVSIFEIILETSGGISALRALRLLRVLRVLRVLGKVESLRVLLGTLVSAASDVMYLMVVPCIFIFMFGTLGVSLFAEAFDEDDPDKPRESFENIADSMLNVFRIVTGDDWNEFMFLFTPVVGEWCAIYWIAIVIFGDWIFMNLFIAILLNRMSEEHYSGGELSEKDLDNHDLVCKVNKWILEDIIEHGSELIDWRNQPEERTLAELQDYAGTIRLRVARAKAVKAVMDTRDVVKKAGKSLGLFHMYSPFRVQCHTIAHHEYFELFIDMLIIINCILLAIEQPPTPDNPDPEADIVFRVFDWIFTVIFLGEMIIKCISDGMLSSPLFTERNWTMTVNKLDDKDDPKDDDEEYHKHWEMLAELNLMKLQCENQNEVRRVEGTVVKVTESDDNWVIIQFETFFEEFRMLFNTDRKAEEEQWADSIYKLKEVRVTPGKSKFKSKKPIGKEVFRWVPAYGYDPIDRDLPLMENIMCSADLTDYRRNAYLANGWNQIDGFVVLISLIGLAFPNVKFLRALRAIRPLRLAVRVEQIRVVLSAVVGAIPGVISTVFFCFLFWLVLAILGCNLFVGRYGACPLDDFDFLDRKSGCTMAKACDAYVSYLAADPDCVPGEVCNDLVCKWCVDSSGAKDVDEDQLTCVVYSGDDEAYVPVEWGVSTFNFDDVGEALRTIYIIATLDEWTGIMFQGMDTTFEHGQPKKNNSRWAAGFFVCTVVITAFLSFNLIISVVVDNFNRIKSEKDGSAFLTTGQKQWVRAKRLIDRIQLTKRYPQPVNKYRQYAHTIALNPYFEPFIIGCICLNAISMATEHYNMPSTLEDSLTVCDQVFITIFTLEAVIKLMAIGFQNYFDDSWNIFDFVIVVLSWLGMAMTAGPGVSVARVFRLGRVLRLIQKAETLRTLFMTILYSVPSLWNIGLLLFVVLFVYAVIGMNMFGAIQEDVEENGINSDANFQNFANAMMMLYRVGTGDAWGPVYINCFVDAPSDCTEAGGTSPSTGEDCACIPGETCGSSLAATLYFFSFGLFGALVMINLFIAVILDTFEDSLALQKREKELSPVFVWSQIWSQVDTRARGELEVMDFIHTIIRSPHPVGLGDYVQCAVLLGDHELLSCVKNEKLNMRITRTLARQRDQNEKVMLPFPDQTQVLAKLNNLELLCRRTVDSHGIEKWMVRYKDAVVAVGTSVVGPQVIVDDELINEDVKKVHDWFVEFFSVGLGAANSRSDSENYYADEYENAI